MYTPAASPLSCGLFKARFRHFFTLPIRISVSISKIHLNITPATYHNQKVDSSFSIISEIDLNFRFSWDCFRKTAAVCSRLLRKLKTLESVLQRCLACLTTVVSVLSLELLFNFTDVIEGRQVHRHQGSTQAVGF